MIIITRLKDSKSSSELSAIRSEELHSWLPLRPVLARFINDAASQWENNKTCHNINVINVKFGYEFFA